MSTPTTPTEGAMRAAKHTPEPWGVERTPTTNWIGPMRRDGQKIREIVCSTDRKGLTPEALARNDANAERLAQVPALEQRVKELETELEGTRMECETMAENIAEACKVGLRQCERVKELEDALNDVLVSWGAWVKPGLHAELTAILLQSPTSAQVGTEEITDTRRLDAVISQFIIYQTTYNGFLFIGDDTASTHAVKGTSERDLCSPEGFRAAFRAAIDSAISLSAESSAAMGPYAEGSSAAKGEGEAT